MTYDRNLWHPIGPVGIWRVDAPRPTVLALRARPRGSLDRVTGLLAGDAVADLLPADPVAGRPRETVDQLVERCAVMFPNIATFWLQYAE